MAQRVKQSRRARSLGDRPRRLKRRASQDPLRPGYDPERDDRPIGEILRDIGAIVAADQDLPAIEPIGMGQPAGTVAVETEEDGEPVTYWLEFGEPEPVHTDTPYGHKFEGYEAELVAAWRNGVAVLLSGSGVPEHVEERGRETYLTIGTDSTRAATRKAGGAA